MVDSLLLSELPNQVTNHDALLPPPPFPRSAFTDERGELLQTRSINVEIPDRNRRRKASARKIGLQKLFDACLGVMAASTCSWRLVVGRFGRLGHGELKGRPRSYLLLLRYFVLITSGTMMLKKITKPVAQRQEMVSGTLALLDSLSEAAFYVSRASAPKGDEVL